MKNLFILITIIILTISCESLNSPGEPDFNYSILFNMVVNKKNQKIYVYNVVNSNENLSHKLGKYFVKNAQLLIENNNWNYKKFDLIKDNTYFNHSTGFHFTNLDSLKILPNNTYKLQIKIGNSTIMGSTKTPNDFSILLPRNNSTFSKKKKISVLWEKSKSAKGYIIIRNFLFNIKGNDTSYIVSDLHSSITTDTSFVFNANYNNDGKLLLQVFAFDENYYEHFIEKKPYAGIEGAYGYFGSSILKTVTLNIK